MVYFHVGSANTQEPIPELDCSYNDKFQQCVIANRNGNPRSIEDFPCYATEDMNLILDQIILDEMFQEVQES
jgi:hypothetical protein